ncbi:MAG: hypothetical protein AVDCRST_MAG77-628 [uncultured Chloroflexi bacterium]|uniref:Extracellular solute-binding protein n=1 Tax=uncultured Chloroflexota bacterium TaxID=166587 RepID=A0A6J4HGE6_9CHLR|nr:MAG: hypothetical protein AVDCRST_MAG77-628 [uncultured Chloroflexota bacterium]
MSAAGDPRVHPGHAPSARGAVTRRSLLLEGGVAGAAGSAGLAGCGAGGAAPAGSRSAAEGAPVKSKDVGPIRVWQWDPPVSPFGVWLQGYLQAFQQETGIQTEILTGAQGTDLFARQAAWFASGDVPDVLPRCVLLSGC